MLDTMKLGIPLTQPQHKRILKLAETADQFRWVLHNAATGEILFRKVSGLAQTDQVSYHRELRWDIPKTWEPGSELIMEFSVPKFWYGHNVHLIYDFLAALHDLRMKLTHQLNLKRSPLPDPSTWSVYRVDVCYSWRFPTQGMAQGYLDGLKHLSYPKKKPIIYPTSIVFPGVTSSFKVYLKHPEFRLHDMKALIKDGAALEWVNYLEWLSQGVLRCEATLRTRYLRRKEIQTVADLLIPVKQIEWDEELATAEGFQPEVSFFVTTMHYCIGRGIDINKNIGDGVETPLVDGMRFYAPKVDLNFEGKIYHHPGGGCTLRVKDRLTTLIQYCLTRFVGEHTKMQKPELIQEKLLERYTPVKAARLVSFWLYVQRFGESQAKHVYGKDSFYRSKRDLKNAGVSLAGEPKYVTEIDKQFLKEFELKVPSEHVTNKYDDHRDGGNILNFVPLTSGQF